MTPTGHLYTLVPSGKTTWVANSAAVIITYRSESSGQLVETQAQPQPMQATAGTFCAALALHAPSNTLYCGDATTKLNDPAQMKYLGYVAAFDVSRPEAPALRTQRAISDEKLLARGLHVHGDRLLIANLGEGLWVADIAPDGSLSNYRATAVRGHVVMVAGDGDRLAIIDEKRGLVVIAAQGGDYVEKGTLALDGAFLDLSVRGDRAVVALGSAGLAVARIDGAQPVLDLQLVPACVVDSADLDGNALAAVCTTGVLLYDLSKGKPRPAGFAPSQRIMLHGRFHDGELLVSDWHGLVRYRHTIEGNVTSVEAPAGRYLAHARDMGLTVRNHGDLTLTVEATVGNERDRASLGSQDVPPGGTATFMVPASRWFTRDGQKQAWVSFTSAPPGCWASKPLTSTTLVERPATRDPSLERPAEGDPMPDLLLAHRDDSLFHAPLPGKATRIIFYSLGCAALWPQIIDEAWLQERNRLPYGATPVFLTGENPGKWGGQSSWALDDVEMGYYGDQKSMIGPAEVLKANARFKQDDIFTAFAVWDVPAGADGSADFVVDEQGKILYYQPSYRGAHPLD